MKPGDVVTLKATNTVGTVTKVTRGQWGRRIWVQLPDQKEPIPYGPSVLRATRPVNPNPTQLRVAVSIDILVDVDAYRAEYGEHVSVADIRQRVKHDASGAVENGFAWLDAVEVK